jgi:hypothetical protein
MNTLTLIPATAHKNGIVAKKSKGSASNSIELRKINLAGRDYGCIAVVAGRTLTVSDDFGSSWRTIANNPHPEVNLQELVNNNKTALSNLLEWQ